ncbi:MAG: type I restriction-modification system specificity subunit [Candidatus Methanoperedens nitroreducens]|uniref:Type I restriction-modification system specificity subunit n=1 Tax=Candidatus Methanoperedens nitratireducens TaxID=1392998 RepID=A0A0P8E2A1_9EURY|nr:restriction endonuclease subunit S [Candidatus Methanoperedens sp. BLZ2]KAB2941641.1 MAG: hypothetical protein F9K14_18305 [Candidatus Methanoperedens sp.]KPQ44443.1 MAG: type I restriction-modification system specificity subunit [Candidatus Methanoperedens sp. BLZ1]MBZ0177033.1 restriction endonuclease subunit S [Candidatus Methanoperedens nitroreducens]MCX9079340.1 restriction endonuclease subunit S [Candidatus Methanoperedens sp.]
MTSSIVAYQDFKKDMRFDAEYYHTEKLNAEKNLQKFFYTIEENFTPIRKIEAIQSDNEYLVMDLENIVENRIDDVKSLKGWEVGSTKKTIKKGDVIISRLRSYLKQIAINYNYEKLLGSTECIVLRKKKDSRINKEVLFVILLSNEVQNILKWSQEGSNHPRFSQSLLCKIKIPIPSEITQERIVELITKSNEYFILANRKYKEAERFLMTELGIQDFKVSSEKTNTIKYSDYKNSLRLDSRYYLPKYEDTLQIINKSGYETLTVSDILVEPIKSGATPLAGTNAYIEKDYGIPFFRIVNIKNYQLITEDLLYIRPDIHKTTLKRSQIKPGDVLFSIAGTIGICAVVPETIKEGNINQALAILRLKTDFNPYFVSIYFNSIIGRLISEKISRPVVQSNLNLTELGTLKIPYFPKVTQNKIASLVQECFKLRKEGEELIKNAVNEIENLIET